MNVIKHLSRIAAFVFLSLPGLSAGQSNECNNWQTEHPEWLWCDSFESDTALNTRYEDVSTRGMGHSADDAFDGEQSLRQQYTEGQVNAGWVIKVNNEGFPDHLFTRWYHKYGPGFDSVSSYPQKMARVGYRRRQGNWQEIMRVHVWTLVNNGEPTLDVLARRSSNGPWLPVARSGLTYEDGLNEWTAFELEVKLNTQGQSDGHYRLWINDQLVIERLNVDLRGNANDPINEVMLDTYWNAGAPTELNRYYDNFVISTQKIGLRPPPSPPNPPSNVEAEQLPTE